MVRGGCRFFLGILDGPPDPRGPVRRLGRRRTFGMPDEVKGYRSPDLSGNVMHEIPSRAQADSPDLWAQTGPEVPTLRAVTGVRVPPRGVPCVSPRSSH